MPALPVGFAGEQAQTGFMDVPELKCVERQPHRSSPGRCRRLMALQRLLLSSLGLWSCTGGGSEKCDEGPLAGTCDASAGGRDPALGSPPLAPGASATCGDGVLDVGEECDDGAACGDGRDCTRDRFRCQGVSDTECTPRSADGCSASCSIEAGYVCRDGIACQPTAPPRLLDAGSSDGVLSTPGELRDASVTAPVACRGGTFGAPELLIGLEANADLFAPSLSADGATLFFSVSNAGGAEFISSATRLEAGTFTAVTALPLNSGAGDGSPVSSFDARSLYFYSSRAGGSGSRDLWSSTRQSKSSAFDPPRPLTALNSPLLDHLPWLSSDELTLLFVSTRAGGLGLSDVWIATRVARGDDFTDPTELAGVNTDFNEGRAVLSDDGLTVFFASSRTGSLGGQDLWMGTRSAPGEAFGEVINLTALNSASLDLDPFLSADQRELLFASDRRGVTELWRSVRACED